MHADPNEHAGRQPHLHWPWQPGLEPFRTPRSRSPDESVGGQAEHYADQFEKSMEEIVSNIGDMAETVGTIKSLYNFKAAE